MAATKLAFTTQPAGFTAEGVLTTQPVVTAQNADGSTDTSYVGVVILTLDKASSQFYYDVDPIATTHTVQAGSTASAILVSPALSFPTTLPSDYTSRGYYCFIASSGGTVAQYTRRTIASATGTTQLNLSSAFGGVPDTGATIKVRSGCSLLAVAATCVNGVATFSGVSLHGWEPTALVANSGGLTSATSSTLTPSGTRSQAAELPRTVPVTSAPTITGTTVTVGPTGTYTTIQAAVNARVTADSNLNDAIVLQQGATFSENVILKKKATGTGWIVIKGHVDPCAEGTRTKPSDFTSNNIATVLAAPGGGPAFTCDPGAHHYRLQGIEISVDAATSSSNGVVSLSDRIAENGSGALADQPHRFIVDRCYVHHPSAIPTKFGVRLNTGEGGVVDSYIGPITSANQDNQAIVGYSGTGPYRIHNNYCEAASENIIFGGSDPYVTGVVPSDITLTNNYLAKPIAWESDPTITAQVKNLLEFKNARRVLCEGNVLENNWKGGQSGSGLLFTPVNQGGGATNAGVRDVTCRYNVMRNSAAGLNITQENSEKGALSFGLWRLDLHDNVLWNINDSQEKTGDRRIASLFQSCKDVTVRHNTMLGSLTPSVGTYGLYMDTGSSFTNYSLRSHWDDNLFTAQSYGILNSNDSPGGSSINHGLLVGGGSFNNNGLLYTDAGNRGSGYPATTAFIADLTAAGVATPSITSTWRDADPDTVLAALVVSGTYATAASDGTQLGANIPSVRSAITGVWAGTTPTPTADHLALTTQPSALTVSGVAHAQQPAGVVQDASNATVTSDTSTVTASWVGDSGYGSAIGTLTAVASAGAWAFTDLGVATTHGATGHWHFDDGTITGVDSATITVIGSPAQLLLSTQPSGAVSGVALTQQPVVTVADSGGSTVTSDTSTVTAEWINLSGDATPSGTLTKAAVSGVAAFTDLGLSWTVASTGKWRFTDGSLTLAESAVMTLPVVPLTYVPIVF